MCAINVCCITNKLNYHIIQPYIHKHDFVCLSETKCDVIAENKIQDFRSFVLKKKCKTHKYGGIHGICILVKNKFAMNCTVIHEMTSESIVWIHVTKHVIGREFILGSVYLPHEGSNHYHEEVFEFLADDIITLNAKYETPILLMGDFNSRTVKLNDFEEDVYPCARNIDIDID